MNVSLVTLTFAAVIASVGTDQQPPAEPIVKVGIFGYGVDGSSTSAAWENEPSLESTVYTNGTLCRVGAGNKIMSSDAAHAWHFSGSVVSKTADEVVLQLKWQRLLDGGKPSNAAENSVTLTLRAGDRVALETIVPAGEACRTVRGAFEARYEPRFADNPRLEDAMRLIEKPGPGAGARPSGSAAQRLSMHVDLWLVHQAPGHPEEVIHQELHAPREGAEFAFAPLSIPTPRGTAVVQVKGSFSVSADQTLIFITSRRVSFSGQPERSSITDGTGKTVARMPSPDEVLSFDMPPIRIPGDAVLPNQFSVRVRVTSD